MSNEFYKSLTKEQRSIYRKCKKEADEFFCRPQGYVLHHVDTSLRETDIDRYIQWRIEDLVMMSKEDHVSLHSSGNTYSLGRHHSEETRTKMSESRKGHEVSKETRNKLSESLKGHVVSEETKKKMSESLKGVSKPHKGRPGEHWYNNGIINVRRYEQPEGFVKGRLK